MKKRIRLAFSDQHRGFDPNDNFFLPLFTRHYDVTVTNDHPDYLLYSVFGNDYLNYDCVRICYTGECYVPNFNECDYAIGFDRIEFGDRYLRYPVYLFRQYTQEYLDFANRKQFTKEDLANKDAFCSFVVSNCFAQDRRTELYNKISEYKTVDSGGRYLNNVGGPIKDKLAFTQRHKFEIACENASYSGYVTEKIVDAFAGYAIPIYYGDPDVAKDFNPKAFINCADYSSFDEVLERVKEVDQNDDLYLSMINEPPVLNPLDTDAFEKYLCYIIDQDYDKAFRRPVSMYTTANDAMLKRHRFFEKYIYRGYKMMKNQAARLTNGTYLSSKRTK